jgi:hypothetical protein
MFEISSTNWLLASIAGGLLALSFAVIYVASSKQK